MSDGRPVRIERELRWATPLYTVRNPEAELWRTPLLAHLYAQADDPHRASPHAPLAKRGLFESRFDLFADDHPEVSRVADFCRGAVREVARELNQAHWPSGLDVRVDVRESWFHITRDGGYHDAHAHSMCSWCGIYYVECGDCTARPPNGVNRFYDPRPGVEAYHDFGTAYLTAETGIDIPPQNGLLIVFPSYLRHAAVPYRGERDRVVIAFNAAVVEAKEA